MPLVYLQQPVILNSVGNPINIKVKKDDYQIGDIFFTEVWFVPTDRVRITNNTTQDAQLLQTLKTNGNGDGSATFNISNVLSSKFRADKVTVPSPSAIWQRDSSASISFFTKTGTIQYNAQNEEVKVYELSTVPQFALRAALPFSIGSDMSEYLGSANTSAKFLTNVNGTITKKASEDNLLGIFIAVDEPSNLIAEAILNFRDGTSDYVKIGTFGISTGGHYILNAKSSFFQTHAKFYQLKSYSIYLDTDNGATGRVRASEIKEFTVNNDTVEKPVNILFMNRKGSWDFIQFNKDYQVKMKTKSTSFATGYGTQTFQVNAQTTKTYNSGWLNENEYEWLKDLKLSPYVVINGKPVSQEDTSFDFDTFAGLFSISLTVTPNEEENSVKL